MSKVLNIAAGLAVVPMLAFSAPVLADSPGQLSNGATNYKVRNVTVNGDYSQAINASCNDTVKYSVTVANSDYGLLNDLTVKADLASGNITASAKNANGDATTVNGTAKVTTTGTLQYVAGSTVRIDVDQKNNNQQTTTAKADGVASNGVNVGDLNGSTYAFVQFQAKVTCATPPTVNKIQVCELSTKKLVTINENDFNSAKYTKDLTVCNQTTTTTTTTTTPSTPATTETELTNTGAGSIAGILAAATAIGGAAYAWMLRRQSTR